ncbi:AAA family ATPase [bacterium]|nr:AAA family ATPase [bacterium]
MQSLYGLQLFGPFRLQIGEASPMHLASERGQALLSYLLLHPAQMHTRVALAELLWPEQPEKRSRQSLRQILTRMRSELGGGHKTMDSLTPFVDPFIGDYKTLRVDGSCFEVDALRFQALLQNCAGHKHSTMARCPYCAGQLRQAVSLYQGELLAGLAVEDSPAFESWLLMQRERFHRQATDSLQTLVAYHHALGDYDQVRCLAEQWIGLDAYAEDGYVYMIEALALLGERSMALLQYERCVSMLAEELNATPSRALLQLHTRLTRFREPAALKQMVQQDAPKRGRYFHFPQFLTPFFGREAEIVHIAERLADPRTRLLTVTGPGGIGKSRLIVEASQHVNPLNYPDGIYFVPLASLTQPAEVIQAIADALSIRLDGGGQPQRQLMRALAKQRLLLVLDNFEQLMETVPLLMELLSAAPDVTCLISSRHPLLVQAERQLPLDGLAYPAQSDLLRDHQITSALIEQYSALAFFVERAQHIAPNFTPRGEDWPAILQICRLVQGMPLAITMAASWLSIYDCAGLAEQLGHNLDLFRTSFRDMPTRHQNLRATFDVSWRLLPDSAKQALARLAVFRGTFTSYAAEEVGQVSPLDLAFLVTHALVTRASADRFVLHQLLRQFAVEKLEERGEVEAIHRAHSRYFLRRLAAEDANLVGVDQFQAIARLHEDAANLSAAWLASGQHRDWQIVQESLAAFEHYWSVTGMHAEGLRLAAAVAEHLSADLAQATDADTADADTAEKGCLSLVERRTLLARLQLVQGILLRSHAPLSATLEILQKALSTAADLPESALDLVGQIHLTLSANYNYQGDHAKSEDHLNEAYQRLQDSTDYALQAKLYVELSAQAGQKGDMPRRLALQKKAVALAEQSGDLSVDFYARGFLVFIQTRWGDFSEMHHHLAIMLRNARLVKNELAEARTLNFYGGYYFQLGDFEQMHDYNTQVLPLFEKIGDPVHLAVLYARMALHALFIEDWKLAIASAQQGLQSSLVNQHMNLESIASIVLGRAFVQVGNLGAAWEAFARARQVYSSQRGVTEELQGMLGQATIHLMQGDVSAARQTLEPALPTILTGHLAGLIDYDHIYADTYRVLRAADDPQAEDVLARGHAIFTRIAATIPSEVHRRSYWQSNPARRFVREEVERLGDWAIKGLGD